MSDPVLTRRAFIPEALDRPYQCTAVGGMCAKDAAAAVLIDGAWGIDAVCAEHNYDPAVFSCVGVLRPLPDDMLSIIASLNEDTTPEDKFLGPETDFRGNLVDSAEAL